MGSISPQMKKAQRKRQKAKHKLKFTLNAKSATTCRKCPIMSWFFPHFRAFCLSARKGRVDGYCCELERLKCYKKLKWLLNIENRLIVSDPFLELLHLQLQELARLWRLQWKLVLLLALWMNWSLLTNDHNCIDIVWFGTMLWWYTMSCHYNMTNSFKIIHIYTV